MANKIVKNICLAIIIVLVLIFQFRQVLDLNLSSVVLSSVLANDIIQTTQQSIIIQGEEEDLVQQRRKRKIQNVALASKLKDIDIAKDDNNEENSQSSLTSTSTSTSMLALEVESIHHIPDQRQVIVNLQQRKCKNPRLFGRLSGPYVTLIDWEAETTTITLHDDEHDDNANHTHSQTTAGATSTTMLVGTYSLPSPGKYFIEVIGLFCNGPQWNATFQNDCMEDPTTHRLTKDTAFIDIVNVIVDGNANENAALDIMGMNMSMLGSHYGYWKRSDTDNNKNETTITAPLLTRYQPQHYRTEVDLASERCQVAMSLERFAPYQFITTDNNNNNNNNGESRIQSQLAKLQGDSDNEGSKGKPNSSPMLLCFIGLSHAHEMSREVNLWLNKWNATSIVQSININAQFPRFVNPNMIQRRGCNASGRLDVSLPVEDMDVSPPQPLTIINRR